MEVDDILMRAVGDRVATEDDDGIFHRACIGEVISLIYLPFFIERDTLFDAVTEKPVTGLFGMHGENNLDMYLEEEPTWKTGVIPALCPRCGWNMDGERDSVALTCRNCDAVWEARGNGFAPVRFERVPGREGNCTYLPFWKFSTRIEGVAIDSYADFMRTTNQPRVIEKEWEEMEMSFWSPAFKIRPKTFLHLSRQFTLSQKRFDTDGSIREQNLHPVTLPRSEAAQTMTLTLASCAINKTRIYPLLPKIIHHIRDSLLVYLPFTDTGYEMIQEHLQIAIHRKTLEFGRRL